MIADSIVNSEKLMIADSINLPFTIHHFQFKITIHHFQFKITIYHSPFTIYH